NGLGCPQDSTAIYTASGLNIPSGTAYLYGGAVIAQAQTALNNYYFGGAGNLTGGGNGNTASGYQALLNNTTGGANTASGAYALTSNTTGSNNTAVGTDALQENSSGTANTASGSSALHNNQL